MISFPAFLNLYEYTTTQNQMNKLLLLSALLFLVGCSSPPQTVQFYTENKIRECAGRNFCPPSRMKHIEFMYRLENDEGFKDSILNWKVL